MVHLYDPSTQEAEAGGLGVRSPSGLHSKTLFRKYSKERKKKKI
jgi:hypothetical protein